MKLIAVGNQLMRDDGIAIVVAKRLEKQFLHAKLEVLYGETDSEGCFYCLDPEDSVLILDAMSSGSKPGTIKVYPIKKLLNRPADGSMQHDRSMLDLIKIYKYPMKGYLIGIETSEIYESFGLSSLLKNQLPEICREVGDWILKFLEEECE